MNSLAKSILINAGAGKIWAILADVTRTPEWIMGVQESERTGEICEGKGLRWRERSVLENQNIEMDHEMTEWEPDRRLKVRSALPMNGWMDRTLELTAFNKKNAVIPAETGIQKNGKGHCHGKSFGNDTAEACEVQIKVDWDLGIAGMLLGEKKVTSLMNTLFEVTLANLKDLSEK